MYQSGHSNQIFGESGDPDHTNNNNNNKNSDAINDTSLNITMKIVSQHNQVSYLKNEELKTVSAWVERLNQPEINIIPVKRHLRDRIIPQTKRNQIICIIFLSIAILLILTGLVITLMMAFVPCALTSCNSKASVCVNHVFYAECVCDFGYNGNGKEFCDECGITFNQPSVRIVGGSTAVPNSWPSAALIIASYKADVKLQTSTGNKYVTVDISFMCGGTLINRKTVLTAAHCILKSFNYEYEGELFQISVATNKYYPTRASMYKIYLGLHDKTVLETGNINPAHGYKVDKIIVHESYDESNVLNDISILKLAETANLNQYVQLACLPDLKWGNNYPLPFSSAWILGWGTTSEGGPTPDFLKNANVYIYNSSSCENIVPTDQKNWNSQICAGITSGGVDTCQGDSGGGIFVKNNINNKQKYVIAGIVSYGEGCGEVLKPG